MSISTYIDETSKLYNRDYFEYHLNEKILESRLTGIPVCVLVLEIGFDRELQTLDSDLDEKIKQVAQVMKSEVRSSDIRARLGDGVFGIILVNTEIRGAKALAKRLKKSIEEVAPCSIVITKCEDGDDATLILEEAENILQGMKLDGENTIAVTN